MMTMKLDFTAAWNDAVALLKAHKDMVLPIAGVFILLPAILLGYFIPEPEIPAELGDEAMFAVIMQFYKDIAPWLFLTTLLAFIGNLAIYSLVLNDAKPTVGEALRLALGFFLPMFVASMLSSLAILFGFILLIVPGIYLAIKFSLVGPALVAENIKSPVAALSRSWQLTKGNSLNILAFYLIIGVVAVVIYLVIAGLLGALVSFVLPASAALLLMALISGILETLLSVAFLFVAMAVYRQLSAAHSAAAF
jgi:Membrane domain of glycerophosphoryl diester phosphodiesterase